MYASHRDQENLAYSQQVPTKQHPKTPATKQFKTPSRFGKHDENSGSRFAGKAAPDLGQTGGTNKNIIQSAGKRRPITTPLGKPILLHNILVAETYQITGNPSRAILGNKTTNAKARTGQTGGVKAIVRDLEQTSRLATAQRPKLRDPSAAPNKLQVKEDACGDAWDEQPEYAPPRTEPLPYESDVLPHGLTMKGLCNENLLRGYFDYYYGAQSSNFATNGQSNSDKDVEALIEQVSEQNRVDLRDLESNLRSDCGSSEAPTQTSSVDDTKNSCRQPSRNVGTISSRRAAAALSGTLAPSTRLATNTAREERPSKYLRNRVSDDKRNIKYGNALRAVTCRPQAEAASRTTIGYTKGKTASSALRSRSVLQEPNRVPLRQLGPRAERSTTEPPEAIPKPPQFLSIFSDDDDEGLAPFTIPEDLREEDEDAEDFVLLNMA